MATLQEVREKYPVYNSLSDEELADKLHAKYYSNIPKDEYLKKIGLNSETKEEEPSTLDKAIRYGVKDPLIGLTQFGENLINSPHNLASLFSEDFAKKIPKLDEMDYSSLYGIPEDKKNIVDRSIQFAPEVAASFAVPATRIPTLARGIESIPKVGKYLQAALGNALTQGGLAASQSSEDQRGAALTGALIGGPFGALSKGVAEGSPLLRKLSRGLLGTGAGVLGYEGATEAGLPGAPATALGALTGALGYRGLHTKRGTINDVLKGVEGSNYKDTLAAADRLGLSYITPAEASGNPFTGATQGSLGKTPEGAQLLYKRGKERVESEKASIENLLKTVFDKEKLDPKVSNLYKESATKEIAPEDLGRLQENEVFKKAQRVVQSRPAYKESLKGIPENSIAYLDHIKQAMDDLIEKAPSKEGRIIQKARNELLQVTDSAAPQYKEARSLAEREIARNKIEEAFNRDPMTGSSFAKFLKNGNKYEKLLHNLRNVPEAQAQLKDMKQVFGRLINIPTAKNAEALRRTSMSESRSDTQDIKGLLKELMSGNKYDKTAVELITDPKWADQLKELKNTSGTQKFVKAFSDIVGKAGAQGAAQKSKRKDEK